MQRKTMSELVVKYLAMRRKQGKASGTVRSEGSTCERFALWWDKTRRVPKSLTQSDVEDYLYSEGGLVGRVQPSTFNTNLTQMGGFLRWAIRRDEIRNDVLDALNPLPTDPKDYTRLELPKLVYMIESTEDEWERWLLTLASQTLGRDGELRRLKMGDFQTGTKTLLYYRPKTKDPDELPITAELDAGYRRWVTHLQDKTGQKMSSEWFAIPRRTFSVGDWTYHPFERRANGCSKYVQLHAARVLECNVLSLKGQGVHLVRRSMARAFYDRLVSEGHGDPLRMVMTLLSHANPSTTERYLGIRPDRLRRNDLLAGSSLLWTSHDNVVPLSAAIERSGSG